MGIGLKPQGSTAPLGLDWRRREGKTGFPAANDTVGRNPNHHETLSCIHPPRSSHPDHPVDRPRRSSTWLGRSSHQAEQGFEGGGAAHAPEPARTGSRTEDRRHRRDGLFDVQKHRGGPHREKPGARVSDAGDATRLLDVRGNDRDHRATDGQEGDRPSHLFPVWGGFCVLLCDTAPVQGISGCGGGSFGAPWTARRGEGWPEAQGNDPTGQTLANRRIGRFHPQYGLWCGRVPAIDRPRRTSTDKLLLSLLLSAQDDTWIRKNRDFSRFFKVVPAEGLEPPRPSGQQILSLSRLPFRHAGSVIGPAGTVGPALPCWQLKPLSAGVFAAGHCRRIRGPIEWAS